MSRLEVNGKEVSRDQLDKLLEKETTVVQSLSIELPNPEKSGDITMEGFDIPADFLISMAKKGTQMESEVTATFSNCGKLGGKTVVITVK